MRRSTKNAAEQQARGNFTPSPRTAVPPADAPATPSAGRAPAGGGPGRFSPRNWRVPTRLNAILLVPVLVGLVMGGFQVSASLDTWREARNAERTAVIVRAASEYGQALLNERDLTAEPLLTAKSEADRKANAVVDAYATTDAAKQEFDEAVRVLPPGQGLERRLELFRKEEPQLQALRKAAYTRLLDPVKTEEGYTKVQHVLMEFSNELGLGADNVTSFGRTVYAVQLAKAAESLQRSIGMHMLLRPSADDEVFKTQSKAFNSYKYLENIAVAEFVSSGTQEDVDRLSEIMTRKAQDGAREFTAAGVQPPVAETITGEKSVFEGMANEIGRAEDAGDIRALIKRKQGGVTPETWMAVSTGKFEGYAEVEAELFAKTIGEATRIADEARTDAFVTGGAVVVSLLAAFILAGLMARQMSRSMRRLRHAALGVAEQRLPMLVDQLSRTDPGKVDTRVEPIPIDTHDEIGEVARAFDHVHREAVRLASEQALLRGNVNAIFTNLSRRNQSLIEGQLTLITELENEADPEQLENLFKLDHLATRMRRNGENLLVLAGEEPGRRWDQPVPLVDVMRAAVSEVEQYERVELSGIPEADIHGQAVTDLVHLLAELLENATSFSSPQTKVRVTATRLPDGRVMIEIHDRGIGLTAEDFADINHKLANPPTVDVAVSQRMGLFVVGRLADRHGIRVQLRPSGEQAGTTSLVMLPDAITHGGGGEPQEEDFTVSQIIPEQQAYDAAPVRTAAELGFDDSRYEPQQDGAVLDPVGRSLMRKDRRAALGAQLRGTPAADDREQERYEGGYEAPYGQPDAPQAYPQQQYGHDGLQALQEDYRDHGGYHGEGYAGEYFGGGHASGGHAAGEYPGTGYPEGGFGGRDAGQPSYGGHFGAPSDQGGWSARDTYGGGYADESESSRDAYANEPERVGFDRPASAPATGHELTGAGLPLRGSQRPVDRPAGDPGHRQDAPEQHAQPVPQAPRGDADDSDARRSANDELWQRAGRLREPKAGGVTASGLPRRVPKANLIEGTAEQTPRGGPQVSRAPEDVRGRLSNLRRGVQQGRSAGAELNGSATYDRHSGPGSTYNQER
ncbi:sensor histidine kinase [Streptomyces somaliensis]|uniref:histidine kinase n=1 Tax=Streptomyces somaliensis (strain ATCC 33201 / DSM 40738 / JCM 12659 / KCTC 9044 / NCTC 11332 / NRRL B-12077 / IP 733) TaxID=1134445 RepID=A0AA44DH17_STRE0|nr:nitrate- and nitrite sensing domain-containing protein [Streptomyces somaliensis]NKY16275.1 sensor histidine kinase [Streptomyces somaliensis DSM 40738]